MFVVLSFLAWRFFPYKDKKIPVKAIPEMLWGSENEDYLASDESIESVDIILWFFKFFFFFNLYYQIKRIVLMSENS